MKKPRLQDDAFLADIAAIRSGAGADPAATPPCLWWLGQSGFLVHWNRRFVLLDPYLSDSLTVKYARTDKPHVRLTERVVAPGRLDFIDVVTSSHQHTDHLDPETLQPLVRANPHLVLICPEANRSVVQERSGLAGERVRGLDHPNEPRTAEVPVGGTHLRFTAIPAAHEALDRDPQGRLLYLGYVVEMGPFRLYHSGDTVLYPGMAELLRPHRVDVALLPINGRAPERRVAGNLWGREAAQLAREIGARLVVPCHYDMFAFNTATPDVFAAACAELGQPCRVIEQGQRLDLDAAT